VESLHASAPAFLRPQSSSLRDHQHPAGRDRARLFDPGRFKRKFVTTLADLRGEPGSRIVGYVLIPQGGTVTYCSGPRTAPTGLCSPLVAQGPSRPGGSPAALPATRVLAASPTGQSALGLAPRRIRFLKTSRPRRSVADLQVSRSGSREECRPEGRRYTGLAALSKPQRGGKAARLKSEPCPTLLQPLFNDSMNQ
jgi:hypothetical protein